MALKRKRSSPTISSPASVASDATTQSSSPPPFSYQQTRPIELSHKPTWSFPTYEDQPHQHLNSRTRKRYRNNRPDEQSVYGVSCWLGAVMNMSSLADVCRCAASTITKLYAAQKQLTNTASICSSPPTTPPAEPEQLPPQRTTLHSFWRIPQPPPQTSMAMECQQDVDMSHDAPREDDVSQIDNAMDIDETCHSCQRWIRNSRTVGNLRVCRTCADSGYR